MVPTFSLKVKIGCKQDLALDLSIVMNSSLTRESRNPGSVQLVHMIFWHMKLARLKFLKISCLLKLVETKISVIIQLAA